MKKIKELMHDISKPLEFAINPDDNAVVAQQYTGDDFLKIMEGLQSRSRETVISSVLEQLNTKLISLTNDTFDGIKDSVVIKDIKKPEVDYTIPSWLSVIEDSVVYLDYFKSKLAGKTLTIQTPNNINIAYNLLDAGVESLGDLNNGYLSSLVYFMENDVESLLLPSMPVSVVPSTSLKVVVMGDDPELIYTLKKLIDMFITHGYADRGYSFNKVNDDLLKLVDMVRDKFLKAITKITSGSCTLPEFESEMKHLEILTGGMGELEEHISNSVLGMRTYILVGRNDSGIYSSSLHDFISTGIPSRIRGKHGCI